MNSSLRGLLAAIAGLGVLALAPAAFAQHDPAAAAAPTTGNMQGDQQSWIDDPHIHAFYDLSVAALRKNPAKADVAAYEQKSYAIFRDFGAARGMGAEKMQDHLKLIPRQVVQIAKADATVLDSYGNFVAALFGPK